MKKFLKIAGILFGSILVLLLVVPFFINVDKFRPQIEEKIGEAIHSRVKMGKLSLGLVPTIHVHTEDLEITPLHPRFPESIVKCSDFSISVPLTSLIFSPSVTIHLEKPEISVIQKDGEYNFETLMTKAADRTLKDAKISPTNETTGESSFIENKIKSARLSVDIENATINYKGDEGRATLGLEEFYLKNLGLDADTEVKIVSNVNYEGEVGKISGPLEINGKVRALKSNDTISAKFFLEADFSKMLLKIGSTFHKPEKTPFRFSFDGNFTKGATMDVAVQDLKFELASFVLAGKMAANAIGDKEKSSIDIDLKNQSSQIEDLLSLSPLLSDYKVKGKFGFTAKAKGPLKNPALDIDFRADSLNGKTPKLNLPIHDINVHLIVRGTLEEPQIELSPANFFVGKSDVKVHLKASGLKAPNIDMAIASKNLDLAFLTTGKEAPANASGGKNAEASNAKALDAALDEMAPSIEKSLKNPMLDKVRAKVSIQLDQLKLQGATINDFHFAADYASRVFKITQGSLRGYGGTITLVGSSRLNPAAPTYDYSLKLNNIDLGQVIAAHAPGWKGQLSGTLKGDAQVAGEGMRKAQLAKTLHGGIHGDILNGTTSLQLTKIVSTIMKQLPQKPDLKNGASGDKLNGRFKTLLLDSKLAGRQIVLNNLDIVYAPDEYNLGDLEFKGNGNLTFDKQLNMTGIVFISPQVLHWPPAIGKSGKIEIPVKVSGPMDNAKPDIGYTISKMAPQLLKNTAQQQGKQLLNNVLKGKNPGDFLKGLFH